MKDIITGHEQTASDTVMLTAQMYKRAAVSEGDTARLAKAMKKAARGERILVSAIGGSITQGSLASESTQSYVWLSYKWWLEKFPDNR